MENINYNDYMKEILTDQAQFESFRNADVLYADKTMYAYRLAISKRRFFFISRPRRFGKSLFCSMLHSLFEGKKELFKGLYIAEKTDYDFESFPVIHLNFATMSIATPELFVESFKNILEITAMQYGLDIQAPDPAMMLVKMLPAITRKTGKRAVVIIDEYDHPMTGSIGKDAEHISRIRDTLNDFYSCIKNSSEYIRLLFITGVVRLANLSIFSAMNNLVDISMNPVFAAAFGYTETEFLEYFGEGIDEHMEISKDEDRESFIGRIREYYDGYRFSPRSEISVYNPVSIGSFFNNECVFENYWDMTGMSSMAVDLAKRSNLSLLIAEENLAIGPSAFTSFDISQIGSSHLSRSSVIALLYYSGYLTFKDEHSVGFPNAEIEMSFMQNLVSRYAYDGNDHSFMDTWEVEFAASCATGDERMVREKLDEYFDAFSYEIMGKQGERFYHAVFHAIFILSSLYAIAEDRGRTGRADEMMIAGNHIWIFELKVDRSAEEALRQIEEKGYAERYSYLMKKGMEMHKVGISFSSKTRKIEEWKTQSVCL